MKVAIALQTDSACEQNQSPIAVHASTRRKRVNKLAQKQIVHLTSPQTLLAIFQAGPYCDAVSFRLRATDIKGVGAATIEKLSPFVAFGSSDLCPRGFSETSAKPQGVQSRLRKRVERNLSGINQPDSSETITALKKAKQEEEQAMYSSIMPRSTHVF